MSDLLCISRDLEEWSFVVVSTILIGFPSFQMLIVTRYSDNALPNAAERDLRWMKKLLRLVCNTKRGKDDHFFCNCFNRGLSARAPMPIRETGMK